MASGGTSDRNLTCPLGSSDSAIDRFLVLHVPDFFQVQLLRASSACFSREVTEWLHDKVRMMLPQSISIDYSGSTPVLSVPYTPTELGMNPSTLPPGPDFCPCLPYLYGASERTRACDLLHPHADGMIPDRSPPSHMYLARPLYGRTSTCPN